MLVSSGSIVAGVVPPKKSPIDQDEAHDAETWHSKFRVVPFDESNQPDSTTPLKATRRLIKVDFSAIEDDDEEDLSDAEGREPDRGPRPNPWHRTGTAATTLTHDQYHHYCDSALECTLPPQNACRVTSGCLIL